MAEIDEVPLEPSPAARLARAFAPGTRAPLLWSRWIFLRALGALFFSAFYSLARPIHGLIGPRGILPAGAYLDTIAASLGPIARVWAAPTLLWLGAGDGALTALVALGMIASVLLVANVLPRAMCVVCVIAFVSFTAVGQEFANYQSDGMLLEAGFLSAFFAPRGLRPGLGGAYPPSRASLFLLQWEWFRIYFESGVVKLASGDRQWRELTAMDHYYENGPLPTWVGWYVQHLPHAFHAATALATLVIELAFVWLLFFGRRARLVCFVIVTPLQIGIILTANYAFLNYLVLFLGILLVDDAALAKVRLRPPPETLMVTVPRWRVRAAAFVLTWIFYATIAAFLVPPDVLLYLPEALLEPFRIANRYGLFAVMTEHRYEIEFEGTRDGKTWLPYPFRYKPQDLNEAPGIYAPYQPRFEWNLWFASLGRVSENEWVVETEQRLMEGEPSVLALFRRDPFAGERPLKVRAVLWQYWFTDAETKRATGAWWRREEERWYAPMLERKADGTIGIAE